MKANRRNRLGEYERTASIKAISQIRPPEWRRNVHQGRKNLRLLLTAAAVAPRRSRVRKFTIDARIDNGESFKKKDGGGMDCYRERHEASDLKSRAASLSALSP